MIIVHILFWIWQWIFWQWIFPHTPNMLHNEFAMHILPCCYIGACPLMLANRPISLASGVTPKRQSSEYDSGRLETAQCRGPHSSHLACKVICNPEICHKSHGATCQKQIGTNIWSRASSFDPRNLHFALCP
jgi:hypothetical protein